MQFCFPTDGDVETSAANEETTGLLEGIGLDGDSLAPMETDEPSTSDPKGKPKITPAMAARIKQIKPLLSGLYESCSLVCYPFASLNVVFY